MARISQVLVVPATGAYYFEDLSALQDAPIPVAERYAAPTTTAGFGAVREVAEALSVGLVLEELWPGAGPRVVWGDCVSVAYSGKAGREAAFRATAGMATVQRSVAPALVGRDLTSFRELIAPVEDLRELATITQVVSKPVQPAAPLSRRALLTAPLRAFQDEQPPATEQVTVERPLHPAVRYGVSQALLAAVALARGVTLAEVIADEWGLPRPAAAVPIHAQSGSERYAGADKMIVRRIASLPHGLVDNIPEQVGDDGLKLTRYVRWLADRIRALAGEDYRPTIHLDLHGALGQLFGDNLGRILGALGSLETAADPYPLRVESPVIMASRAEQIATLKRLREYVRFRQMRTALVADEWANTLDDIRAFIAAGAADMIQIKMPDLGGVQDSIEAVLACKAAGPATSPFDGPLDELGRGLRTRLRTGVGAFLGGSCAETDLSARVAVHVALATRPDIIMARPGMGVDEAISITQNEMARALAEMRLRAGSSRSA